MESKRKYGWVAVIVLCAYCQMLIVKQLHRHHSSVSAAVECVLDGESIDLRHTHSHSSFLPMVADKDDCPLCQFQVQKISVATVFMLVHDESTSSSLQLVSIFFVGNNFLEHLSTRAPPICG